MRTRPSLRLEAGQCVLAAREICRIVVVAILAASATWADDVPLNDTTSIQFATVEQAVEILGQQDVFIQEMGPLERQLRMQSNHPVSVATFLEFVRQQALAWPSEDVARVTQAIDALRGKFTQLKPLWPATIPLIRTTGREEGQAPHCRGNAIVLPVKALQRDSNSLQNLLLHELFHILSRQSGERQAELYEVVGFRTVAPIQLPTLWQDRRITNPDAAAHQLRDRVTTPAVGDLLGPHSCHAPGEL